MRGTLDVLYSVLAALFGVQSEAKRQRDFQASSPLPYILTGVAAIVLFVLTLLGVVGFVLA